MWYRAGLICAVFFISVIHAGVVREKSLENLSKDIQNSTLLKVENENDNAVQVVFEIPTSPSKMLKECYEDFLDIPLKESVQAEHILRTKNKYELTNIYECLLALVSPFDKNYGTAEKSVLTELSSKENLDNSIIRPDKNRTKRNVTEGEVSFKKDNFAEFYNGDENKLLWFLHSISVASNEFEKAVYNTTNIFKDTIAISKRLPNSTEAKQLKDAANESKLLLQTIAQSGKKISESIIPLPLESTFAAGGFAKDSILQPVMKLLLPDEASQLKAAIDDVEDDVSGKKEVQFVKELPGHLTIDYGRGIKINKNLHVSEEVVPLKTTLENGVTTVANMLDSTKQIFGFVIPLPLQAASEIGNFALDNMLEKAINVSKSEEAFLLNLAMTAGANTVLNAVDSGIKFVDSVKEIPKLAASSIKSVALEAVNNTLTSRK